MSRVYFTATFQHKNLPIPTFSFETNDHTGGGYEIAGLHPSSIAALIGKPPDVKPGERFDLKFNLNKQRASLSLVVFTTKHLPHVEWSSDGGMGRLPLAGMGALATQFLKGGKHNLTGSPSKKTAPTSSSTRHKKRPGDGNGRKPPQGSLPPARRRSEKSQQQQQQPRDAPSSREQRRGGRSSSSYDSVPTRDKARDHDAARARRRRRKDDWGYDSGYASDEAETMSRRRSPRDRKGA